MACLKVSLEKTI